MPTTSVWGRLHLVNAYEVKAGISVIAGKTVWSMQYLECEVPQYYKKEHYINTLTFTYAVQLYQALVSW